MNYVVFNSSKCFYYRIYKTDHKFEKYFDIIDGKLLRSFVNCLMCNNVLPIEKSRWLRQDINNRTCTLCNTDVVGGVIILLNVLFSLKIEIQYYLQDFVETQICILYKT